MFQLVARIISARTPLAVWYMMLGQYETILELGGTAIPSSEALPLAASASLKVHS
jgi:hypothetical protein